MKKKTVYKLNDPILIPEESTMFTSSPRRVVAGLIIIAHIALGIWQLSGVLDAQPKGTVQVK